MSISKVINRVERLIQEIQRSEDNYTVCITFQYVKDPDNQGSLRFSRIRGNMSADTDLLDLMINIRDTLVEEEHNQLNA